MRSFYTNSLIIIDDDNIYLKNLFFKIELSFDTEDAFH